MQPLRDLTTVDTSQAMLDKSLSHNIVSVI